VPLLPAKSTASPETDWPAPFAVSVTSPGQTATLERSSEHVKWTFTGPTYQPPSPRGPPTTAAEIVGAVLSSMTIAESTPRLPARSYASPSTARPAVSSLTSTSEVVREESTPEP